MKLSGLPRLGGKQDVWFTRQVATDYPLVTALSQFPNGMASTKLFHSARKLSERRSSHQEKADDWEGPHRERSGEEMGRPRSADQASATHAHFSPDATGVAQSEQFSVDGDGASGARRTDVPLPHRPSRQRLECS